MAQPFGVGDVVGGRYRITHHVVTSADQDIVFQASDEVLDRDVSILLASWSNAKQVATSARELAMGSRDSDVQVLDLGLAEQRTYLISSLVDPNTLLDLVVPDTAPYVEPFFTDSLGSELFGQSRVMEPETYADDDEYYAGLHAGSVDDRSEEPAGRFRRRRPAFLNKVSDSLNRRLNTGDDAAVMAVAAGQAEQGRAAAAAYLRTDMEVTGADPAADTEEDFSGTRSQAAPAALGSDASPASSRESAGEESASSGSTGSESTNFGSTALHGGAHAAAAGPAEAEATAGSGDGGPAAPGLSRAEPAEDQLAGTPPAADQTGELPDGDEVIDDPPDSIIEDYDPPAQVAAPLPGPPRSRRLSDSVSFTGLIRPVPRVEDDATLQASGAPGAPGLNRPAALSTQRPDAGAGDAEPSGSGPAGTTAVSGAGAEPPTGEPADRDFQDEKPGIGRWVTAAALAALLVVAAVIIFMNLRGGETPDPAVDQDQDEGAEEAPAEESEAPEGEQDPSTEEAAPAEDAGPAPEIANITRVVPDSPDLIADRDGQLANLFDGDTDTTWVTLSFATAEFGGFSSGVGLVAELEEPAEVSAVTVEQPNGSNDGSFEVLVNDSANLEGAEQVGSGSLNWNETTVEVDTEGEVAYVILNITELPRQDSPNTDGLPFSAEIAEISID